MTLNRDWSSLVSIAQRRRNGAEQLLEHLLSRLPKGKRGNDLLVETTLGKLMKAIESDIRLQESKDLRKLKERSLMWLHEQEVIRPPSHGATSSKIWITQRNVS